MSDDYCPMSDLPVEQCDHCRLGGDLAPVPDAQPFREFIARYAGTCGGCSFDINPGETIRYSDAGSGSTITHTECT